MSHKYAAVRCDAAAGSEADRTAAITFRCHVSTDPAAASTLGCVCKYVPLSTRPSIVVFGTPAASA